PTKAPVTNPGASMYPLRWITSRKLHASLLLLLMIVPASRLRAQQALKPRLQAAPEWFDPAGVGGSLLLCNGDAPEKARQLFRELAGGDKANVVLLSTTPDASIKAALEKLAAELRAQNAGTVSLLLCPDRKTADGADFVTPLRKATGVWLDDLAPDQLAETFQGTLVEKQLGDLLRDGKVIGANGAGAALLAQRVVTGSGKTRAGCNLLPGTFLDLLENGSGKKQRQEKRLPSMPGLFGISIEPGAALVVRGRQMNVLGDGKVIVRLAADKTRNPRSVELTDGRGADYTALRRMARNRDFEHY